MPTFEVKQIQVPLFGVVEASNQEPWFTSVSGTTALTRVQLDSAALDFIANDLELDAEGLAGDAERYVNGSYRAKARGMGGSRLGDLGEVLTYLVNRTHGQEVVRVVSWRAGTGQAVKGSRFPQPDFILKNTSGLAALEVKSTEAFDFVDLRDTTKKWMHLQPCSRVNGCREQALPQLGFVAGTFTPQQHNLVVQAGHVVPFPVGKGIAAAVLAVDGRTNALRSEAKYMTPPACRSANRKCWSCLPEQCHIVLVTMQNAPGVLSLAGAAGEGSTVWFRAYQRWSQALAAHDLLAVRSSLRNVVDSVTSWLDLIEDSKVNVIRSFWGSYLHDAMRSRGFNVEVPQLFGNLSQQDLDFEWAPAPVAEPEIREASVEDVVHLVSRNQGSVEPFSMSVRLRRNDQDLGTISVRSIGDYIEFHLMSEIWWTQREVETEKSASLITSRLLSFALEVSDWPDLMNDVDIPLRAVSALVGDTELLLGWESKAAMPRSALLRSWWRDWPFWFEIAPWPILLAYGDPRARVRITPDGRAKLRVLRTLLHRR